MIKFNELKKKIVEAEADADKFFINENMTAGKRYFAKLMEIHKYCKSARVELSEQRSKIRKQRKDGV